MTLFRVSFLAALSVQACLPANLAISTYFKDGFTPSAIASDAQGNVFVAGTVLIDPATQARAAAVAKFDAQASRFLYFVNLDQAANDQISAIAIDSAGNAYVTGATTNPNFPVVGGGSLGTAPAGDQDPRSFVTKLGPDGHVILSVLIGGSVGSRAMGIALTPQGQILVSGIATATGFPSTQGAYSVADSSGHWFLMELDAAARKIIFSATGIGGSSIAFDKTGNIYLAGSSSGTDYPTTPGAYQTTFVQGHICYGLCQLGFNGALQHVTKVDPTGSTLIYSTGLNDTTGGAGSTMNSGLVVDPAGNVFVTGTLLEAAYPFTVPAPRNYSAYVTKLDPTGSSVLFSVPVGGGGVALDSSGSVYVGGVVSSYSPAGLIEPVIPVAPPAIFSWVPQQCWPNNIVAFSEAYVMKLDPASGNTLDAQWIDGSAPQALGITLAGGNVWLTGFTPAPDVPFTPGNVSPSNLGTGFTPGAFLAAINFSSSAPAGAPALACVLDGANTQHVRALAPNQVISLFGANLGPATGVAAPDGTDPSIAGVTVTFDGKPAPLLYVSSSQINVEAPANASSVMRVTVNGQNSIQRQFPPAASNLNLFANLTSNQVNCPEANLIANGFQPLAMNADGSTNSCANPAQVASTVSFFIDGAGSEPLSGLTASASGCPAPVQDSSLINEVVYKVDIQLPASTSSCFSISNSKAVAVDVTFSSSGVPAGPLGVPPPGGPIVNFTPGQAMPMVVWVAP